MDSAEGVVPEVDAIVEAHQKGVRVSGTLVSMGLYVGNNVSSQFPDDSTSVSDINKRGHSTDLESKRT